MTEMNNRPGFPLRLNSEPCDKKLPEPEPESEEEEYMLKWGEHSNQVINIFHQLCQDNLLTDVTLATETKTYKAHKLILSACSPYFRNLFVSNPCEYPTVFFKDISEAQMDLLMEYMYRGKISVKQSDLENILRTATSLQIHGLTTTSSPEPPDSREQEETGSIHSSASSGESSNSGKRREGGGGRKSSKPKKLRLNSRDEREDVMRESPMFSMMSPRLPASSTNDKPALSPVLTNERPSPAPRPEDHVIEPTLASSSDDNIAASDDEEAELVIDQPVDFSTSSPAPSVTKPKTHKTPGGLKTKPLESLKMSTPMMGTWEEQLASLAKAAAKTKEVEREEEEENRDPSPSMSQTMGLDIAAQLKSHFLASLPTQSYAWLNGLSGLQGAGGGVPPNTPQEDKIKERTPLGGIRTGEIGPNGKPSVECEDCGKVLADPSSLYRHRKIHTGEKPHKCPYCDRRFIQRFNMKQHIKTHRIELMAEQNAAAALSGFAQ